MQNADIIYSLYKPFRNRIRNYNLIDCLYIIWGYSRNFTFNLPFPEDIEIPKGFIQDDDINNRRYHGIPEFEQELLLKEFILNCEVGTTKHSLRQADKLSKVVNYLRKTLGEAIDENITIPNDFLFEFNRIVHRQFKWQLGFSKRIIVRHYKVFSDNAVDSLVRKNLELSIKDIYFIGLSLFQVTSRTFLNPFPIKSTINFLPDEKFAMYFKHFSINIDQARIELKTYQELNENYLYSYNPLLAKPILTINGSYLCPMSLLIFWQVTNGIYYSIVKEPEFNVAFGNSFQNYIGDVIKSSCKNVGIQLLSEAVYGKEEKRTTDWIMVENEAILFVECKAKRMTMSSKTGLNPRDGLDGDLKKMAGFIIQIYKTYIEYTENKYPQIEYSHDRVFFPLIVTLEDWYINFNLRIMDLLKTYVLENAKKSEVDPIIIEKFPFHIRSAEEFEKDIQLIDVLGIQNYFSELKKENFHDYAKNFQYTDPFENEFKRIFLDPLA